MTLRAVAVIPARIGSTRLAGKPLLLAKGRPLIAHVIGRALECRSLSRVIVATDDERIAAAARAAGAEAALTDSALPTGSDRIGAILPSLQADVIVNLQGDEPSIDPALVDRLVRTLESDPESMVATAAAPFPAGQDPSAPDRVKVVIGASGRALYFSRSLIPFPRNPEAAQNAAPLLHVGVYAYRRAALEKFLVLPRGRLETRESLEQLRLLEHGIPISVVMTEAATESIDTPADWEAFRKRIEAV